MNISADQERLLFGDMQLEGELGAGGMGKVQLRRSLRTGERFAVKWTRYRDWAGQRNFLIELMTWYGLPRHPHFAECRFFWTFPNDATGQSEIAIFAEYVPGGSLADWIAAGKLTRLDQILDVAIQFAWGLHAAHEAGVVHQDVKPGNVLLAPSLSPPSEGGDTEGVAVKVADFGLARARARAGEEISPDSQQSMLVSWGGMTRAYCSPEQLAGERLTRKTDVWSWAVSILDMLTGKPNRSIGSRAHKVVFKEYLANRPSIPDGLVDILNRCFREDPAERWQSMAKVADALRDVYRTDVRQEYPRPVPPQADGNGHESMEHDRRFRNVQWADPREWLVRALQAAGRDPAEAEARLVRAFRRSSQPIADLIGYEEARRILEQVIASGLRDHARSLAFLLVHKALVHEHVNDAPGAFGLHDRAIDVYERLVEREGRRELANDLATACLNKATALQRLGDLRGAVGLHDRAIDVYERLVEREGRRELANYLAAACMNKAIALAALGDLRGAVGLYDRAIDVYERLVEREGRRELANDLATACVNKANALAALGDLRGAVGLHDRAIDVFERLVEREGRGELRGDLAWARLGRAKSLLDLGERERARAEAREAVAILQAEVARTQRADLQAVLDWALNALREVL